MLNILIFKSLMKKVTLMRLDWIYRKLGANREADAYPVDTAVTDSFRDNAFPSVSIVSTLIVSFYMGLRDLNIVKLYCHFFTQLFYQNSLGIK